MRGCYFSYCWLKSSRKNDFLSKSMCQWWSSNYSLHHYMFFFCGSIFLTWHIFSPPLCPPLSSPRPWRSVWSRSRGRRFMPWRRPTGGPSISWDSSQTRSCRRCDLNWRTRGKQSWVNNNKHIYTCIQRAYSYYTATITFLPTVMNFLPAALMLMSVVMTKMYRLLFHPLEEWKETQLMMGLNQQIAFKNNLTHISHPCN